jgi:hypothetical protein
MVVPLRGPSGNRPRERSVTLRGGVKGLCMAYMVAIWLRGLVLRRQITDREYRLASCEMRAAATKH